MDRKIFHHFEDGLLVLDEERRRVYRLPAELVPEAEAVLAEPVSSTSRRQFLHALAAGSVAGVMIIALPSAAAASSLGGGSEPSGGGGDPVEQDPQFTLATTSGDGSVTVTVS